MPMKTGIHPAFREAKPKRQPLSEKTIPDSERGDLIREAKEFQDSIVDPKPSPDGELPWSRLGLSRIKGFDPVMKAAQKKMLEEDASVMNWRAAKAIHANRATQAARRADPTIRKPVPNEPLMTVPQDVMGSGSSAKGSSGKSFTGARDVKTLSKDIRDRRSGTDKDPQGFTFTPGNEILGDEITKFKAGIRNQFPPKESKIGPKFKEWGGKAE